MASHVSKYLHVEHMASHVSPCVQVGRSIKAGRRPVRRGREEKKGKEKEKEKGEKGKKEREREREEREIEKGRKGRKRSDG